MKDEPPIEEQLGIAGASRKGRVTHRHERPELFNVKVRTMTGWEIWITPYNRFFLVDAQTGACGYPHLIDTGLIRFEPSLNNVPPHVVAAMEDFLARQKALRRKMVEQGEYEDGEAWEWS